MPETSLSLIERLRDPSDSEAWQRLLDLYAPLIQRRLGGFQLQAADRDDLVQEVLATVVRKLPEFCHEGRTGSFRAWLRILTVNRLREFWQARRRPVATGDSDFAQTLDQLEDPENALSRRWDEEHDRYLVRRLLEIIEPEFEPMTLEAFRQAVIEGEKSATISARLGISVNAVLVAKSRLLRRLRRELVGFLD